MKKNLALAFLLLALNAFAGGKHSDRGAAEDRDILAVIEKNLKAAEEEDFDAWMATYHERARACKAREAEMLECFRVYDMEYDLESARVVEKSDQEAKVLFIQFNRKLKGPELSDKKVTGIHVMKKSYGKWKIYDTEIKKIQELR